MKIKVLHHKKYFGQKIPTFKSIDLEVFINRISSSGYDVELMDFESLQFEINKDNESLYICGSHQNPDVKRYLDDILSLPTFSNVIIPNRDLIRCHENKGYQGIYAKYKGIEFVNQSYYIESQDIEYKRVLKLVNGAGSGGVTLVDTKIGLNKFIRKALLSRIGAKRVGYYLRALLQLIVSKTETNELALEYYKPKEPYVLQEFIDGLTCDYKVLVFNNKCFVLKRNTRTNDFRASGSGKFEFIEPEEELLEFSLTFRVKLETPYISIDVIKTKGGYKCIEFQCAHFGPYTQINAEYYYEKVGEEWMKNKNNTVLEELLAESIVHFIEHEKC
ncbi:hypothetical protein EFU34_13200 [Vibrio cholerae]|nr:hypothetical protein [Vibrio cholerae]BCN17419.1 hypothetical protein [Vibrio cholerae]BCN21606.1 hypothetical protein [Vibrio cholerae]GHZ65012.1 hypothetical protein VCSRO126_3158 [Vibrio cholerae]GHZ73020.1 hypothetical protein VCSRO81_2113 [Vibrio cholerae]